ncbi:MAG: hypothetical protein MSA89_07945 [Clostridium sp.]|nr:hypothetical protein [Clostridium sp.]
MKKYIEIMESLMKNYHYKLELLLKTNDLSEYYNENYDEFEDKKYISRLRLVTAILYSSDFKDEDIEPLVDKLYLRELKNNEESAFSKSEVLDILASIRESYKEKDDYKFFEKMENIDPNFKINLVKRVNTKNIKNLLIEECIEMTLHLKEYETASKLIDEWTKEQKEWNIDNLGKLYYYERDTKNYKKQLETEEKIIDIVKKSNDNSEISERLNKYAKDLINFNYYEKAKEVLKEMMPYLEKTDITWYKTILGQAVLENYMDLILKNTEDKEIKSLWNEIEPYLLKTKDNMSIILKSKMEKAKESIA